MSIKGDRLEWTGSELGLAIGGSSRRDPGRQYRHNVDMTSPTRTEDQMAAPFAQGRPAPQVSAGEAGALRFYSDELHRALGTTECAFGELVLNQLLAVAMGDTDTVNAGLAFVHSQEPRNETEALIAVHMFTAHSLAITAAARAAKAEVLGPLQAHTRSFERLSALFIRLNEARLKLRTGGEQTIVVQHVHVNDGGQAVVGNLQAGGPAPS